MHTLNDIYTLLDLRAFASKTGVTTCIDTSGAIPCGGTGQDGEYQRGITWPTPRFTDNGDGTVTDNLTQLIWLQDVACLTLNATFAEVLVLANNLQNGQCGLSDSSSPGDWRLPNISELFSVQDLDSGLGTVPSGSPFTASVPTHIFFGQWSSTPYNSDSIYAIERPSVIVSDMLTSRFARPVRGGP